jgi:hypothetical protein
LIHVSCGALESTGKRIASLCAVEGRGGKAVKDLHTILWRDQSERWHDEEQYEMERHEEQSLVLEPLQMMQVGAAIFCGRELNGEELGSGGEAETLIKVYHS